MLNWNNIAGSFNSACSFKAESSKEAEKDAKDNFSFGLWLQKVC